MPHYEEDWNMLRDDGPPPRGWAEQRTEGYATARSVGTVMLIMIMVGVVLLAILLT